ncbi:MAG TPA: spermidine/putrescine ABC transporter substrate-binding protein [Actinomycetota bacterium]|nr:spermidine/putrescine ABC transporter substrate-binding protein [Actinomycetota bacterium]
MTDEFEGVKVLASRATVERITRRHFLAGSAVAVFSSGVLLAACGEDTPEPGGGGGSPSAGGEVEDRLNFFHWAEYDDPEVFKDFENEFGATTKIDVYASNEEAIAKLTAASGTTGYDIVVPTGVYIPQMVSLDLLEEINLDLIPNFENVDEIYRDQPWDPGNKHSVCKDWGSTGWIYDKTKVSATIETWDDFIAVTQGEASGQTSVLDTPGNLTGIYFWANDIDWATTDTAHLDACEEFIVNEFAPHIKAYDSYPGIALTEGKYALSHAWNGDARQGLLSTDDPDRYVWGLGAPVTELWMDNWCIVKGAQNPNAAHAWINFICDPEVSLKDLAYHGYNTGIVGVQEEAEAAGLEFLDMIFFSDEQVATMDPGAVNEAQQRIVDIWNKAKAASGA